MASKNRKPTTVAILKAAYPRVGDAFLALREAIERECTLDRKMQELIVLASYVVARQERGFKTHAGRALDHGATLADVKSAVLVTLGATAAVEPVGTALQWADDVVAERGSQTPAQAAPL